MQIEFINRTKQAIPKKSKILVDAFIRSQRLNFSSLAVVLVGTQRMKNLNRDYRGKDKATDVLSFSPADFPGAGAEIILCPEIISRYRNYRAVFPEAAKIFSSRLSAAQSRRRSEYLFYFVLIHGLLHLAGQDDASERGRLEMVKNGRDFLRRRGFSLEDFVL